MSSNATKTEVAKTEVAKTEVAKNDAETAEAKIADLITASIADHIPYQQALKELLEVASVYDCQKPTFEEEHSVKHQLLQEALDAAGRALAGTIDCYFTRRAFQITQIEDAAKN